MNDLAVIADELDALVLDGRRIRLGDRDFVKPHADLDALLARLEQAALAVRLCSVALPMQVVTGRNQMIVSVARPAHDRHSGPPSTPSPRAERRILHVVPGSGDAA